jgi:lipopolysaccharide transport system permease protein
MAVPALHRISPKPPSFATQMRELLASRDLFAMLVTRELKVRYKQTALGAAWVILQPLVPALIFTVVLGTFARLPSSGTPYFLFAMSGLVVYGVFSSAVTRAASSFVRDGQIISKVYVPRAILPLASGAGSYIDFSVGGALLLVLMLASGIVPPFAIVLAPVVAALALALGLGLGLVLAGLGVRYRDFLIAVPFVTQILMYVSPVVYSMELVPTELRNIYALNPLVGLIEAFRWTLFGATPATAGQIAIGFVVGALAVVVAVVVFIRSTRDLADVL